MVLITIMDGFIMLNTPQLSLAEINNTVPVARAKAGFLRKLFAFSGPVRWWRWAIWTR